jgi:Zn-dependent peptidase ImmA (M78 family)
VTSAQPDARSAAAEFRAEQHLGTAPIADLITVLEDVPGVHVAVLPAVEGDHHGMRASDPVRGVTVLAAVATAHAVRLRSTLAHEFGHHLFGDPTPANWSEKTPTEERATEFARHLLVPIKGLIDLLGEPGDVEVSEAVMSRVVERYAVSPQMAAIQLREAGFIDDETADQFRALTTPVVATRHGWADLYRQWSADSTLVRPPRRIIAAAINAYIGGDATIETLAHLRGIAADSVRVELDEAGIAPRRESKEPAEPVADDFDWDVLAGEDADRD